MIPIHDTIVGKRMPIVTWTLMGLNALVFLGEVGLPGPQLQTLMQLYGMVPRRFVDPVWAQQHFPNMFYWPFVTSLFLHGSWMHIISNMWTLWIFGDNVEDRMGPARYLIFYLACGVLANLLHLVTNSQSLLPTVGASGAIAGIMGAYIWMFPHSRVVVLVPILFFPFFFEFPAFVYLGVWFFGQLYSGILSLGQVGQSAGIAFWAHVGGFVAGLLGHRLLVIYPPDDEQPHVDGGDGPSSIMVSQPAPRRYPGNYHPPTEVPQDVWFRFRR